MFSSRKKPTSWIWLLCIVLLAVRIGGAHLHLCFDGMEPPLAVHAGEPMGHDAHHDEQHSDADLNLLDNGIAKTFAQANIAPALIAALIVLFVRLTSTGTPISIYRPPFFRFIPLRFSSPRAPPR